MTTADTPFRNCATTMPFSRAILDRPPASTEMPATLGYDSLDALTKAAVPATIAAPDWLGAPTEENASRTCAASPSITRSCVI